MIFAKTYNVFLHFFNNGIPILPSRSWKYGLTRNALMGLVVGNSIFQTSFSLILNKTYLKVNIPA